MSEINFLALKQGDFRDEGRKRGFIDFRRILAKWRIGAARDCHILKENRNDLCKTRGNNGQGKVGEKGGEGGGGRGEGKTRRDYKGNGDER